MPSVKLDPNKQYYLNVRFLEAQEPSTAQISVVDMSNVVPPPPPGCTEGPISKFYQLSDTAIRLDVVDLVTPGVACIEFPSNRGDRNILSVTVSGPNPGGVPPNGMQVAISECKGSFDAPLGNENNPSNCSVYTRSITLTRVSSTVAPFDISHCRLKPNTKYYLNIRWFDPNTNTPTCSDSCGVIVDFAYSRSGEPPRPTCTAVPGTSIIYLLGNYEGRQVSNPNEPNRSFFSLSANQPVATSVRRQRSDNDPRLSADIIQNGNLPVYDICLSECPGSFEIPPGNEGNPSNCKLTGVSTPSVTLKWATRDAQFNECRVRADKPLYVNTRLVNCPDGNCGLSVGTG